MNKETAGEEEAPFEKMRSETSGGRITLGIDKSYEADAQKAFADMQADLAKFSFWRAPKPSTYRPAKALWLPQRRAVELGLAYLAARASGDPRAAHEAALIKMPTGTGKTAAIATLACASGKISKTLIITPRKGLIDQLRRDLSYRFWEKLGATFDGASVVEGVASDGLQKMRESFDAKAITPVRVLEAGQYQAIWDERTNPRQVLVSTFNALHLVLGLDPPAHRSFHGRSARGPAASLGNLDSTKDSKANRDAFIALLRSVDLVIVDEGHYEPAISWAQAVRALGCPTLIFSATPYRNDYKYFEVQGSFVFNLSWQEAVRERLVRDVTIGPSLTAPPALPAAPPSEAEAFVSACAPALASLPAGKRAIVHAASYERLLELQQAFVDAGETVLLIHDAHRAPTKKKLAALPPAEQALIGCRFRHVADAERSEPAKVARIWLHQFKLLEGIDDSRFIEAWLYDPFQSARQLIQQVGRLIRRPDLADPLGQTAVVRASNRALSGAQPSSSVADQVHERWQSYLDYELYVGSAEGSAFIAETQLLATVKRTAPAIQYVGREFRHGHLLDEKPDISAFLLPRRATICRVQGVTEHKADAIDDAALDRVAAEAMKAMEVEERFDIQLIDPPAAGGYENMRLVRYLSWRNSPYLAEHHLPEWKLGLMAIARAGRYLFLLDTEGICIDTYRLGLLEPEPDELRRLFPAGETRIVETSAIGLDLGEFGLRSLTVRRSALDEGYFDLAEASQIPTSVRGYGPLGPSRARRRLSFGRASLADASFANLPAGDWLRWTAVIADKLADTRASAHRYFDRFAERRRPLAPADAAPKSILLDLWDLLEPDTEDFARRDWDEEAARRLLEADSLCMVHNVGTSAKPRYEFTFAGHTVKLAYMYRNTVPAAGRYKLSSSELNEAVRRKRAPVEATEEAADLARGPFGSTRPPTLLALLNQEQSFRVIPAKASTVYSHGSFFRPRVGEELLSLLEPSNLITHVLSEKGETRVNTVANWDSQTLFGLVWSWMGAAGPVGEPFADDVHKCDIMICDDSQRETADFYGVDEANQRILIIHAKASDGPASATARKLQEVGRQAQTSLAFAGSSGAAFDFPSSWSKDWSVTMKDAANATIMKPRLIRAPVGTTIRKAHRQLSEKLADPRYRKHIIIQTAGLLSKSKAEAALKSNSQASRQFIYYLASLRTSFDRAGVVLRIVCDP